MKNVLVIDATNDCQCDLLGNINNNTNDIILDIRADVSLNPILIVRNEPIPITTNNFVYTIPYHKMVCPGTLPFNIKDDMHVGDTFTITFPRDISKNWLLKQLSNFAYELSMTVEKSLIPITDNQIDEICI